MTDAALRATIDRVRLLHSQLEFDAATGLVTRAPGVNTGALTGICESLPALCDAAERHLQQAPCLPLPRHDAALHLTHNDHNSSYQTVAEHLADELATHGRPVAFVSEEERRKAIVSDELWELQWYPNSPVSFRSVCASSIEAIWTWLRAQKLLPDPPSPPADTDHQRGTT